MIEVEDLTVTYDKTPALVDVSLSLGEGKIIGVIGPNGAGKSTFLKALLGLVKPVSGHVRFWGKRLKQVRHRVSFVPQRSSVDWDFPITAFEVVLMGCYGRLGLIRRPKKSDREAAMAALKELEMDHLAHRPIAKLSGGQQQRLFIARALMQKSDITFFDEPFAGIDMATEKMIVTLFKSMKEQGKTVVVVHHDLSSVEDYFDEVVILNQRLIAVGKTSEVFTAENLARSYGKKSALFLEVTKLSGERRRGLS